MSVLSIAQSLGGRWVFSASGTFIMPGNIKKNQLIRISGWSGGGGGGSDKDGGGGGGGSYFSTDLLCQYVDGPIQIIIGAGGPINGDGGNTECRFSWGLYPKLVVYGGKRGSNDGVGGAGGLFSKNYAAGALLLSRFVGENGAAGGTSPSGSLISSPGNDAICAAAGGESSQNGGTRGGLSVMGGQGGITGQPGSARGGGGGRNAVGGRGEVVIEVLA